MYSEALKKEVRSCHRNNPKIQSLLEDGSIWLGAYLADSCLRGLPFDMVLEARTLDALKKAARLEKRRVDCYKKWREEDSRRQRVSDITDL